MKSLKIILFFIVIGLLLAGAVLAEGVLPYPTFTKGEFSITSALLTEAGFTKVQDVTKPETGAYFPVHYFKVGETLSEPGTTIWGNAANLVSVFIRKMPSGWLFNNGEMKIDNLDGKISVSGSQGDYYFVVIGPDQSKAIAILNILAHNY